MLDENLVKRFNLVYQIKVVRVLVAVSVVLLVVFTLALVTLIKNSTNYTYIVKKSVQTFEQNNFNNVDDPFKNVEILKDDLEEVEYDRKPSTRRMYRGFTVIPGGYLERNSPVDKTDHDCLSNKWKTNWDGSDSLAPMGLKGKVADKIFIFIRTAESDTITNALTTRGRRQSNTTASRLKYLGMRPDSILTSPMQNSFETAKILHDTFQEAPMQFSTAIYEGDPVDPSPAFGADLKSNEGDFRRIEKFLQEQFYRPAIDHLQSSQHIIVLDHNILKYILLRLLQLPTEAFMRVYLSHASISQVHIRHDGTVFTSLLGDNGHLEYQDITY